MVREESFSTHSTAAVVLFSTLILSKTFSRVQSKNNQSSQTEQACVTIRI